MAAAFDIVFCPCATDGKVRDMEKMADGEIDVCLFNGGIRTSEQEYMARLLRRKSKVLVAFGSCASEGCIPGLANMNTKQEIFETGYQRRPRPRIPDGPAAARDQVPRARSTCRCSTTRCKTLDQTVTVDYYLPGCPPEADRIWDGDRGDPGRTSCRRRAP